MTWSKKRDDLIAQTKAFVQSVKGGEPQPAPPEPAPVTTVSIKNPFVEPAANTVRSEKPVAAEPIERAEQTVAVPPPPAQSDVRNEIQSRVAAFQAHQHRFRREREAYFNSVLTKLRSDIENSPDTPTL